jgi:3-methyladenine DNA glycosylase/8-oxoguanine DNA glycosylase
MTNGGARSTSGARTAPALGASATTFAGSSPADAETFVVLAAPYDLARTVAIHRRGGGDPAFRIEASGSVWRATRTPDGPATLFLQSGSGGVRVRAWGPGAAFTASRAPGFVGADDDPHALVPVHPAVTAGAHLGRGLRIGSSGAVLEALIPAILEQKITGDEARRTYRNLVREYGEDAPGPPGPRLPPRPEVLAALPYHAFHPLGLERRRAELIRIVGRDAVRLERLAFVVEHAAQGADRQTALASAYAAMRAYPGIGPWTAAEVGFRAFGDPDAVSVGDFHIPNMVCWALAREPRGTDERMLELLEPYRGQRARVTRLLELAGVAAPRYGPRLSSRRIGDL